MRRGRFLARWWMNLGLIDVSACLEICDMLDDFVSLSLVFSTISQTIADL